MCQSNSDLVKQHIFIVILSVLKLHIIKLLLFKVPRLLQSGYFIFPNAFYPIVTTPPFGKIYLQKTSLSNKKVSRKPLVARFSLINSYIRKKKPVHIFSHTFTHEAAGMPIVTNTHISTLILIHLLRIQFASKLFSSVFFKCNIPSFHPLLHASTFAKSPYRINRYYCYIITARLFFTLFL